MAKKNVNEKAIKTVMEGLASIKLFKDEPSVFSDEWDQSLSTAFDNPQKYFYFYNYQVKEELQLLLKEKGWFRNSANSLAIAISDLYFNHNKYEESVNRLVEALNGGICSYDYTRHVVEGIYMKYLCEGIIPRKVVLGIAADKWIEFCLSLFSMSYVGELEGVERCSKVIMEDERKDTKEDVQLTDAIYSNTISSPVFDENITLPSMLTKEVHEFLEKHYEKLQTISSLFVGRYREELGTRFVQANQIASIDEEDLDTIVDIYTNYEMYSNLLLTQLNVQGDDEICKLINSFVDSLVNNDASLVLGYKDISSETIRDFLSAAFDTAYAGRIERILKYKIEK